MIDHLHNGYVAQYKSSADFANGIYWALEESEYPVLSEQACRKAVSSYSESHIAKDTSRFTIKSREDMHSNRHTPKISVITVTYNAGEVLEDTIQSVISQTYHHVEYILVDGASRDHTMAIANRYRERIHKIISEPDKDCMMQ